MTDRQEAAERLRRYLTNWETNGIPFHLDSYKEDLDTILAPPIPSEVQEAVSYIKRVARLSFLTDRDADGMAPFKDALATLTAALTSASETEAAFIELMEADDPEPRFFAGRDMGAENRYRVAWRKRQALKAAHKARYDALKGDD